MSHRASSCPSWDRTRTLLIQSSPVGVCLEDTMSVSGDLPSIGAPTVGGKCPDRSGETLVKCLQRVLVPLSSTVVRRVLTTRGDASALRALLDACPSQHCVGGIRL